MRNKLRDWLPFIFLIGVILFCWAKAVLASSPPQAPLGYLAIGFEYHDGKLVGAKIMGQSPSLEGCMKGAQEAVGTFMGDNKDPKESANAGCMPIPRPMSYEHGPDLKKPATTL